MQGVELDVYLFFKNCRCTHRFHPQFLGSKEESMACALRRYESR
ncbi:MAG: hypothetical protein P8X79_10990 [Reinekea sp.]